MSRQSNRMSVADYKKLGDQTPNHRQGRGKKHGNRQTQVDGINFDSQLEADVWCRLRAFERSGRIRNLKRQVPYHFDVVNPNNQKIRISTYYADFVFEERITRVIESDESEFGPLGEWATVVADAKGHKTEKYLLKKKMMLAFHGIVVREYC